MPEQSETERLLTAARTLVKQGRYQEAIEPYQTVMTRLEQVDERVFASAINGLGIVYYKLGENKAALDCFSRAFEILRKRKSWYQDAAVSCDSIGVIYNNQGDYNKALEYEFRALKLFNQTSDFIHVAEAFNNIAVTYIQLNRYNEALDYLQRSLKIYEKISKTDEATCCETLNNLGVLYYNLKNYPKAIEYSKRALAIHEKVYGVDHADTIVTYINIGVDYANLLDYEMALKYILHALELLEKTVGLDHPLCCKCYDSLGGIYSGMGNYTLAIEYLQKSLAFVTKTKGKLHLDAAKLYESLGRVYRELGDYKQALQYLLSDMEIRKNALGTEHPDMANVYSIIGTLYSDSGDYSNSLVYGFHALKIREKVLGINHPDTGDSLNEIGRVYGMLNDYETCLKYETKALGIYIKAFGTKHLKVALAYNNIGTTYSELGNFKMALAFEFRALKIEQKIRGTNHPSLAITYHNIAGTYADLRDYNNALRYESRALEIRERTLGFEHPDTVPILQSFSHIYYELDRYEKALEYSLRALEIQKKTLSNDHPAFIIAYANIALLYYMAHDVDTVGYVKKLMETIVRSNLLIFYIPQEELRLSLLNDRRRSSSVCFSVAFSYPEQFNENELYAFELGTKNLVAESSFVQSSLANRDKTSEYAEKYSALKRLRSLYAKYSMEGFPEIPKREHLERQILDGEYALAPYYREIDFKLHMQQATPDAIQKRLPEHAALLEYGRYFHFPDVPYTHAQTCAGDRYFLFLVRKDDIRLFELGDCSLIDALIERVRALLTGEKDADEALRSLYKSLIGPAENELSEISQLFIAPDSELFKLPFELLQSETGERLSQRIPAISYLSTGRDLLRLSDKGATSSLGDITIIADPEFNLSDSKIDLPDNMEDEDRSVPPQTSRDMNRHLKADVICNLPFTAVEADLIAGLFSEAATVISGDKATKSAIRQPGSPSVVHLSTHGFAFAPQYADSQQKLDLFSSIDRGIRLENAENPMLRYGLAFAGICNWLKGENLPEEIGDGILNGLDVLSLDLSNTSLMVLSACQTGLGDTQSGEGIQGLRRAFELAGVHTLICTLWKVDDLASAILMTAFYKNLLGSKLSKLEALSTAKEYTRTLTPEQMKLDGWGAYVDDLLTGGFEIQANWLQDVLDKQYATPFAHPYYWAGFILQGEA
jgi:CHAT domain-containing protein/tetratricopeptide (TPR) repeat protein